MLILAQMALIVRAQSGWGSLRGVHRKVPQPFLPLRGRLKTPSFQLQEPTGSQPKTLGSLSNPLSKDLAASQTQSAGAGGKAQAALRHCVGFTSNCFFQIT